MVKWINHLPCKPGVEGLIPGINSLSDDILAVAPSQYELSCWLDIIKHKHTHYM